MDMFFEEKNDSIRSLPIRSIRMLVRKGLKVVPGRLHLPYILHLQEIDHAQGKRHLRSQVAVVLSLRDLGQGLTAALKIPILELCHREAEFHLTERYGILLILHLGTLFLDAARVHRPGTGNSQYEHATQKRRSVPVQQPASLPSVNDPSCRIQSAPPVVISKR